MAEALKHILSLGTAVMIPTFLVPLMGGGSGLPSVLMERWWWRLGGGDRRRWWRVRGVPVGARS